MANEMTADMVELMDWASENADGEIERFVIDNDVKADWALRKIQEIDAECERMNAVRRERIETLKRAIEAEEERRDHSKLNLCGMLQEYFASVPARETKTQWTYKLPSGSLVMKKASTSYVHDDEKLTAWLEGAKMTDYLKVTTSPRWGEFKKHLIALEDGEIMFGDTGEVLPDGCVTLVEVPQVFGVSAK